MKHRKEPSVLLVFAPYPYAKRYIPRQFPLGIGYISAVLRENGIVSRIIDLSTRHYTDAQIERLIESNPHDIVGISAFTENHAEAARVASIAHHLDRRILTVMGGAHATFQYRELLRDHHDIDIVAVGEGEFTMLELCRLHAAGKSRDPGSLQSVEGLAFRDGTSVCCTGRRRPNERLDDLPFPAFDTLVEPDIDRYFRDTTRSLPVLTSRGCPFACAFCSTAEMHGRRFRPRAPERVVDEMEVRIRDYGLNSVSFVDDIFTFSRRRVERICEEIVRRGISVSWGCSARVDTVDQELLGIMRDAGCTGVFYGIESLSDTVLESIGKQFRRDDIERAVGWTIDAGMEVDASFILGLPGETRETLDLIPAFVERHGLHDRVITNNLQLLPGTPMYMHPKKYGLTVDDDKLAPWRELRSYVPGITTRDILETILEIKLAFHRSAYGDEGLFELEPPDIEVIDIEQGVR